MLYIIGLGLNEQGISLEGKEAIKKCKRIYLEGYTVKFSYSVKSLEIVLGRKVIPLDREYVESEKLAQEAKDHNICLLVYGSPLFATTHMSLIEDCEKFGVEYRIIYAAGVFDALAETGLQLYKFGKISSMPKWEKGYHPDSFLNYVIENKKIDGHSLILVDIGLNVKEALEQLEIVSKNRNLDIGKILVCSILGTKFKKIYYGKIEKLKEKKILAPFCIVIPGKMHFLEEDFLKKALF